MNELRFKALGMEPATKGSYRVVGHPARLIPMNAHEKPWRQFIADTIRTRFSPLSLIDKTQHVFICETFYLLRPVNKHARGRAYPNVKPDIDKLQRALHDALTDSGLIIDDSIITEVYASKEYVETPEETGVYVIIKWKDNNRD